MPKQAEKHIYLAGGEPSCPLENQGRPNIFYPEKRYQTAKRIKHLHVPGRIEDSEIASEAERQFYEQIYHGFKHLDSPESQIHPECFHQAAKVSKRGKNRPAWSMARGEYPVKSLSAKRASDKPKPCRGRIQVSVDEPPLRPSDEKPKLCLPKWATDVNFGSSENYGWPTFDDDFVQDALPSEKHVLLSQDEELEAVPSWARQVTVNTLNETIIFKDDTLKQKTPAHSPKMSHTSSHTEKTGGYLNNNKMKETKNKSTFISGETIAVGKKLKPSQYSVNTRSADKNNSGDNCKGQELISSLMKSPIETFEKLMTYLMSPGAIDEEDITGVEMFDECNYTPFAWTEGNNFLAFVKEKHLKQAIDYCNIATQQMIKKHIKRANTRKEQECRMRKQHKTKENVSYLAQATGIKEVHQADDQIEVIGYIGCTGTNKRPTLTKECDTSAIQEHENDKELQQDGDQDSEDLI